MQLRKTSTREFLKTANSARTRAILQFLKTHSCLFIRNCTRNYTITYTKKRCWHICSTGIFPIKYVIIQGPFLKITIKNGCLEPSMERTFRLFSQAYEKINIFLQHILKWH